MSQSGSTAGHPIQPGERFPRAFGEYLLLTSFGRGGMGEVYLAKRGGIEGIDHLCVVKRLRADLGEEEEYVRRFIDEARLVVQLNHGNICHVFDVGRVASDHYLAMEYIAGVNVRTVTEKLAERGRPLERGLALHVMGEVLDALDYAHRHENPSTGEKIHLVHRDVSPHNVMVSIEGEVKLIDFGLAASELKAEKTESHVVMGKVAYMSPEQARGELVDGTCDQFAAAIILYELLTGRRFYGDRRLHEIWQIVGLGGYLPDGLSELAPPLQSILKRALAASPRDRFPNCEELREELVSILHREHPGTSKRHLRQLMQNALADEVAKHRKVLSQYQDLSAETIRHAGEATMSFASRSTPRNRRLAEGAHLNDGPSFSAPSISDPSISDPSIRGDAGSAPTKADGPGYAASGLHAGSGSLPTGVMPLAGAPLDVFQTQTEETATATAFVGGKKSDSQSHSIAAASAKVAGRGALAASLVGLGAVLSLYVSGAWDKDPPLPTPPGAVTAPADPAPSIDAPPPVEPPPTSTADATPAAPTPPMGVTPTGVTRTEAELREAELREAELREAEPREAEPRESVPPESVPREKKDEPSADRNRRGRRTPSDHRTPRAPDKGSPAAAPFVEEKAAPPPAAPPPPTAPPKPNPPPTRELPKAATAAQLRAHLATIEPLSVGCATMLTGRLGMSSKTSSDDDLKANAIMIDRCYERYGKGH